MRYRERLWPAVWVFIATTLVIPASLLVFLPISPVAGVVVAIGLYAAIVVILILTTPTVELDGETFRAGRARIPRQLIARSTAFSGSEATAERGTRLDARAWLLVRGWLPDVVRVELGDPNDPTPYWLVASRHADELARALNDAGQQGAKQQS